MFDTIKLYFREMKNFSELFDEKNARARSIVFYSEREMYYQYYEGVIEYLLAHSDVEFCYLTSDPSDRLFEKHNDRMKVFYTDQLLPATLKKLAAKVFVMTMPDLHQFHVKRSPGTKNHIYVFHAIVSTHLQYRLGAFDHYDTVFCAGPHHVQEIRRTEELYHLKPKALVETGYHRLEKIYRDHQAFLANSKAANEKKIILVAPTWGESSLLEICGMELIDILAATDYDVVIRPHPEFIKRRQDLVKVLGRRISKSPNMKLETDLISDINIHKADVLITDRSGIAFEYAFGTERPVLYIDTPLKVNNPEYTRLGIEPMEVSSRNATGVSVKVDEIQKIPAILSDFIAGQKTFRENIIEYRNKTMFNWMRSAAVEGEYILSLCREQNDTQGMARKGLS